MDSKFYKKWSRLREQGSSLYSLSDNNVLVEVMPEEEVKVGSSGLVLAHSDTHRPEGTKGMTAVILDVGKGYYNADTDSYTPLDVKAGNVVLLPEWSVQLYRQFPGFNISTETRIGLTTEDQCKLVYKDMDAFDKAKELLNADEEAGEQS